MRSVSSGVFSLSGVGFFKSLLLFVSLEKADIYFNLCRDLADKQSGESFRGRLK